MLVWIGSSLLTEWLFRSYRRLSLWEYLVIILIFVVIAFAGFAWGLFVGVIAALMLFVVEYGRVDIVRLFVTGRDYQSSIDASEERRQTLAVHGAAILIMRLQGFLFFGTADRLRQRVERRAVDQSARTRFVVIDFRRVTGLDSSTVVSFVRLSQTATREGFTIVFTGVSEGTRATMLRGGLDVGDEASIRFIGDLDAGLKWCEDELLARAAPNYQPDAARPLEGRLRDILVDHDVAVKVAAYCDRMDFSRGATLIEQGTPSADIFFVERGHASVSVASDGHTPVRLATVGPGAILGEVAFYLGEQRSASVIAEEDMIVWRFSRESIERLQAEMPDIGLRFHEGIATMLAKRLMQTNHLVRLLAD
jgi:SulP family sulfate permease